MHWKDFLLIFLVLLSIILVWIVWDKKATKYSDPLYLDPSAVSSSGFCGVDLGWGVSDIYFNAEDTLVLNLNFVFFVDSLTEYVDLSKCDSAIADINRTYVHGRIKVKKNKVNIIVDSDKKYDMPSFVKHGVQLHEPGNITCFVYADRQDNFSEDYKYAVGLSKGIASNWFAVRYKYLQTSTTAHELGHCLGLRHIDTPDKSNGYNVIFGDKVCDTPSADSLFNKVSYNCAYISSEAYTQHEKNVLTRNLMAWIPEVCRIDITDGQFALIRFQLHNNSDLRKTITNIQK